MKVFSVIISIIIIAILGFLVVKELIGLIKAIKKYKAKKKENNNNDVITKEE